MSNLEFLNNNESYLKYLNDYREYYNLKKKYNHYVSNLKNKILNSNNDISTKKKLYSIKKFKCINCNKEGGTIFTINDNTLIAQCGNTNDPCDLNINIKKKNTERIDFELKETYEKINKIKELIITTKLDYLFNYISQDKAVELFDTKKDELQNLLEYYNKLTDYYTNIIYNKEDIEKITNYIGEMNNLLIELKEYHEILKESSEKEILNAIVNINYNKIRTIDKNLLEIKYKYNEIIKIDDIFILDQKKFSIKDLEFFK